MTRAILDYYELESMPTIHSGHFANLKIDTGTVRVWLSRCSIADGELDPVQCAVLEDGVWITVPLHDRRVPWIFYGCGPRAGVRSDGVWYRRQSDGSVTMERAK